MPSEAEPQNQSPSTLLLKDALRVPLERAVSEHCGHSWTVKEFKDLIDFASHGCAILSDGDYPVFTKLSQAANGLDQFEIELAGLQYLAEHAGVLTPSLIGVLAVEGRVMLVLEAAQAIERTPRAWRQIGQTLARIHSIKGSNFGFEKQGYFGPLYQDNRPTLTRDWLAFYTERRLWPRLMGAIESGNLPTEGIRQVERFISRLPRLNIPEVVPALLHGDAQQNNYISTDRGAMVIDPAVYYGHPEIDLAYVDYFQEVPDDVFVGYQEVLPIDPGFGERRELWRVSAYLAAVQVEGGVHLNKLTRALKKYL